MLAQWKAELASGCVTCIDTDPINGTFAAYTSLDVHRVEILEDNNINLRRFDEIFELIMAHEHDAVIDAGATSFLALAHYMTRTRSQRCFTSSSERRTPRSHRRRARVSRHAAGISQIGQPVP